MPTTFQEVRKQFSQQYIYIVFFATAFMVFGYYAPRVYAYFTSFYTVSEPTTVDRKLYNPCDTIVLSAKRTSLTDLHLRITIQLIKIEKNGLLHKTSGEVREVVVPQGKDILVSGVRKIPCDTEQGTYFYASTVEYTVDGVPKSLLSTSEQFSVVDEPVQKAQ